MSVLFSGQDMLEVAINIERNGEAFYLAAMNTARDASSRAAFENLAGEEKKHLKTFQSILNSIPANPVSETYTGEYALYVKTLSDGLVFKDDKTARSMAARAANDAEIVHLALAVEKDSLLFYWEMKSLLRQEDLPVIDRIMDEERAHVRRLTALERKLEK